jgi:hypothetical protein
MIFALLIDQTYGFSVIDNRCMIQSKGSEKKDKEVFIKAINESKDALFTVMCFGNGEIGHSFSILKYEGVVYLMDSWYLKYRTRVRVCDGDIWDSIGPYYNDGFLWKTKEVNIEKFNANVKKYSVLEDFTL